jgi:hypothetical protein
MTTKKKIFRLINGGPNAKRETGQEYVEDTESKNGQITYNQYYKIETDHLEKEDTVILLHKMEE